MRDRLPAPEVHRGGRGDPVVGGGVVLGIERRSGDGEGDAVLGGEIPADLEHGSAAVLEAGVLEERVRHVGEADRAQRGDEPVVLTEAKGELRLLAPGRVDVGLAEPDGGVVEAGRRGRDGAGVATVEVDLDERRERRAGPAGRVVEREARTEPGLAHVEEDVALAADAGVAAARQRVVAAAGGVVEEGVDEEEPVRREGHRRRLRRLLHDDGGVLLHHHVGGGRGLGVGGGGEQGEQRRGSEDGNPSHRCDSLVAGGGRPGCLRRRRHRIYDFRRRDTVKEW